MHLPTLLILNIALSVVVGLTLAYTANRRFKELYLWAGAIGIQALGYALGMLHGQIDDIWSIVLGNCAFAISLALMAEGIYHFQKNRPLRWLIWPPVLFTLVVFSIFINDMRARLLYGGLLLAVQIALVIWLLARRHRQTAGRGQYVMILGFLTALAGLALRVSLAINNTGPSTFLDPNHYFNLIFLGNMLSLLLVTVGAIMMVQERIQHALMASENRYRQLIESAQEGIFILIDERCIFANARATALLGIPEKQLLDSMLADLVDHADQPLMMMYRQARALGATHGQTYDVRLHTAHAGVRWFSISSVGLQWQGEDATLVFLSDIHERKLMEEQVRQLAYQDELTRLPNRRQFIDRLKQVLDLHRHVGGHLALMFIDLNKFKALNDEYGHHAGDQVLIEVAQRLREVVRTSDLVARLGGDEFVLLLQGLNEEASAAREQASQIANTLYKTLAEPYERIFSNETHLSITCTLSASIGIHLFKRTHKSAEILLKAADAAMYRAKKTPDNGVQFFDANDAV
ncbi:diguanylate cyclase domain-containing protein [Pusillimonas minor]|uniref:Diguanylate cyclase n=1 Tax=Pusillimonas minor TaxID=2697024 RepID=A0A842HJR6_9BURK|nr:diguanylate cyclase [Pusillimonas minor]MBC2768547.1 diguanylate cyclase [Pusillimonas minor]